MDATTLFAVVMFVLTLPVALLVWFVIREIRKTQTFFRALASRFDGATRKIPFGVVFELEGIKVRIFALQGSIQYRARIRLHNDPGILVTRTFRKFKFLDALHYSPSREQYLFHAPVDEQYGFRAKDARWMREIFNDDLLDSMANKGRVMRIEIGRRGVRGALLMITQSDDEHEKANQAIDILNSVVVQVSRSTLAQLHP